METIPAFYFEPEKLRALIARHQASFRSASPFPHVVMDNFVPPDILDKVVNEFPSVDDIDWTLWGPGETAQTHSKHIEKLGTSDETKFGLFTRHFMAQLNSHTFLQFLEALTGTDQLIPDPSYNHCGFHSTGRGGKLMIHTDANRHLIKEFDQIYNLILFINKEWKEEYGGHLELWSRDAKRCEKRILPIFNRCVVFETSTYSYHGHPQPLTCPADRRRNSLAIYYYRLHREHSEKYDGHRGFVSWVVTTKDERAHVRRIKLKNALKKVTPPICLDIYNKLRRK